MSEEQEDIWQDIEKDFHTGNHEANSQILCQTSKIEKLDTVEGLAPSKMEKEIVHRVGASNVGAPATVNRFAYTIWKEKNGMMVIHLDKLAP